MTKVLVRLIRFYQRVISPWKVPCCRFYPTCSEYAIEAIREYGLAFGVFLALKRLLKCHPFHHGGYDPLDTDWHPIPSPPRRTSLRGRSASYGAGGLKVHGWAQINKNLLRRTLFTSYLDETSEVRRRKSAEYLKANEVR